MAVVVKYVVERNGVERMTFTSKKEADAYDKMLDVAESLEEMLGKVDVPLSEQQVESLALEMAKQKDDFINVLKGSKPSAPKKSKKEDDKRTFDCDKCKRKFPLEWYFKAHLCTDVTRLKQLLRCKICSKKCVDPSHLQTHMLNKLTNNLLGYNDEFMYDFIVFFNNSGINK